MGITVRPLLLLRVFKTSGVKYPGLNYKKGRL